MNSRASAVNSRASAVNSRASAVNLRVTRCVEFVYRRVLTLTSEHGRAGEGPQGAGGGHDQEGGGDGSTGGAGGGGQPTAQRHHGNRDLRGRGALGGGLLLSRLLSSPPRCVAERRSPREGEFTCAKAARGVDGAGGGGEGTLRAGSRAQRHFGPRAKHPGGGVSRGGWCRHPSFGGRAPPLPSAAVVSASALLFVRAPSNRRAPCSARGPIRGGQSGRA
eukprot:1191757-Prorocentrum_minimum.AAC.2